MNLTFNCEKLCLENFKGIYSMKNFEVNDKIMFIGLESLTSVFYELHTSLVAFNGTS